MGLIDSHAHLTTPALFEQIEAVLTRCDDAGVDRMITIGTDLQDAEKAVRLSERFPERIHVAAAFHPHEAAKVTEAELAAMAKLWDDPRLKAIGEMGLDYHYDFADQAVQRSLFASQLALAASRSHPLIIHCRDALEDALPMLVDHGFEGRPVVFHCFTGVAQEALRIQERGWRISFTGIVTFPNSKELQAIAKDYPPTALMIETDSPYLSPVPVRGRRPNEPAHLAHIAKFLAGLREVPYEQLVAQTARNTREFFTL